jgi:type I restriction enzyme S subunit
VLFGARLPALLDELNEVLGRVMVSGVALSSRHEEQSKIEGQPLPKGWAWAKLGNLLSHLTSGSRDWAEYYDRGSKVFIMAQNVRPGRYNHSYTKYVDPPEHLKDVERSRVQLGDLLITIVGANTGDVCRIDFDAKDYFVCQSVALMRPILPQLSAYLEMYLIAPDGGRYQMNKVIYGAGRPHLSFDQIESIAIPLPPLDEQCRIVPRVDALFAEIDEGMAALTAARKGLDTFRRGLLKAAVTGELTKDWRAENPVIETGHQLITRIVKHRAERAPGKGRGRQNADGYPPDTSALPSLPESWVWVALGDLILEIQAGLNVSAKGRPPQEGETGIVKVSAVTWGEFDEKASKTLLPTTKIDERDIIQSGDFLFSRANTLELVGAPVIVKKITKRLVLSDKILRFRFADSLDAWIEIFLKSAYGRKQIEALATGAQLSMRNISQENIRKIAIPVPPPTEAAEILCRVSNGLAAAADTLAMLDAEAADAARLKQSILKAAFEGRLVPQDPNDESATALLSRLVANPPAARAGRGRARKSVA